MGQKPMDKVATLKSPHGFFSRHGGVSTGVYNSLNCGIGSNDNPEHVIENRKRVAAALGGKELITPYQVHGVCCAIINSDTDDRPEADALVTKTPGITIGILTADCCPVLLEDSEARIVGAAHAGWRGATGGVTQSVIDTMITLGADVTRITAAIGPTIGQASYEVGTDMRETVLKADTDAADFFVSGRDSVHFQFDLPGYVENRLKKSGIRSVTALGIDTYTSGDHYSYRRMTHQKQHDYGRFVSAIMVPPAD